METTGNRGQGSTGQGNQSGRNPTQEGTSVGSMAAAVKDKAQEMASTVADKAGDAWESVKHGAQAVATTSENAWEQVSQFVKRHPIPTAIAGGGVAYLLYRAMRGPSSRPDYRRGDWRSYSNYGYPEERGYDMGRSWPQSSGSTESRAASESGGFASGVAQRAGGAWVSTKQGAQQAASTIASGAEQAWDTVSGWGRSYPLSTLLMGAGLGYVLWQWLGSQKSSRSWQSGSHQRSYATGSVYSSGAGRNEPAGMRPR